MSQDLRKQALNIFKRLHRTRLKTFQGDEHALQVARQKINNEYRKNKHVTDETSIQELIKVAEQVEQEVRTSVIQLVEKKPGLYEARITADTLVDNVLVGEQVDKSQFKNWVKCTNDKKKS